MICIATHSIDVKPLSFDEMVARALYSDFNSDITEEVFPLQRVKPGKVSLVTICFGKQVEDAHVLMWREKFGLQPVAMDHILTLGYNMGWQDPDKPVWLVNIDVSGITRRGKSVRPYLYSDRNKEKGKFFRDLRLMEVNSGLYAPESQFLSLDA